MCQRSSNIGSGPNFVKLIARLLTVVAYFGDSAFAGGMIGCEPDQVACEWMLARLRVSHALWCNTWKRSSSPSTFGRLSA